MISNELLEEVIVLSKKEAFITRKMIIKIFEENYELLPETTRINFKDLLFSNIKEDCFGTCQPYDGIINLDLTKLYSSYQKESYSILAHNFIIINVLFHELEHLKEPYKLCQNNIEGKLIVCSSTGNCPTIGNVSDWDVDPCEKIACANSWNFLLESLKKYPNFSKKFLNEYAFVNNEYVQFTKLGYCYSLFDEDYNIPLIDFLNVTEKIDRWFEEFFLESESGIEIKTESKLDVNTKMKYGFPITKSDVEELNKQKILVK